MSCNYCWNQPKKYERYDLYLDGKIKADDFVYRTKDESGEIISIVLSEKFDEIEQRLETHFTFNNAYKTFEELKEAFEHRMLKESVIYIVTNENTSDDPDVRDVYNEYMIMGGKLELIGSGSYAKQTSDLYTVTGYTDFNTFDNTKIDGVDINSRINKEISDRITDVDAEEDRATKAEGELRDALTDEINRATTRENEIQSVYDSITGYDFKKLDNSTQNIDSRIKKEIKDREDSTKTIEETVESITGYKFEKLQSVDVISEYGWDSAGQDRWSDSKGFDTVIEHTGNLKSILISCSDRTPAGGTEWINVWNISGNSLVHLGTSDNSDVHEQNGELYYTFMMSDVQVKVGDKLRITFHD